MLLTSRKSEFMWNRGGREGRLARRMAIWWRRASRGGGARAAAGRPRRPRSGVMSPSSRTPHDPKRTRIFLGSAPEIDAHAVGPTEGDPERRPDAVGVRDAGVRRTSLGTGVS